MIALLKVTIYLLGTVVFVNRFIAGIWLRWWQGRKWDPTTDDFEPDVTVIIPMFNEGAGIQETLRSLLGQTYPTTKLTVIVVDDCSTDDSVEHADAIARSTAAGGRIRVLRNAVNMGKRRSINRAVRETSAEIVVSVDSDVVVHSDAVRALVRRFVDPRIAAVGGKISIRNVHHNWLTRMQTVKYWYGYHLLKNLEWAMRRVMCLSGCLTAYRRSVLVELEPLLENRRLLGVAIKYGEDRFLTRQIIKAGYLTTMTHDAVCWTAAATTLDEYFSQQLRWRRSNFMDYAGAVSHLWRQNPILAIHFFSQWGLLLAYPVLMIGAVLSGHFMASIVFHVALAAVFGVFYRINVRHLPPEERVGALAFLPIAVMVPVTYAFLTPVALFTLDSGSWETRDHGDVDRAPAPVSEHAHVVVASGVAPEVSRAKTAA
jgi:cellulose synthase/poly-beta-1,6-N-acetylglucosamine synthase-like glycosyltransferase